MKTFVMKFFRSYQLIWYSMLYNFAAIKWKFAAVIFKTEKDFLLFLDTLQIMGMFLESFFHNFTMLHSKNVRIKVWNINNSYIALIYTVVAHCFVMY